MKRVRGGASERLPTVVCPEGPQSIITGGIMLVYPTIQPPESSTPTMRFLCTYCFYIWRRVTLADDGSEL